MQDLLIEIGRWPSIPLYHPLFIRLRPWMTSIPSKEGCASLGSGLAAHTAAIYDHCRKQLLRFGTQILTKTVNKVDFSTTPFKVFTNSKAVIANSIIVATSVVAKQLNFLGFGEGLGGFWN